MAPNIKDVGKCLSSAESAISWFQDLGLLTKNRVCICGEEMKTRARTNLTDGSIWQCPKAACRKECSVRKGSIFEGSKLPLTMLGYILYFYALDTKACIAEHMLLGAATHKTILEWYEILRGICSRRLIGEPAVFGNEGEGDTEEVAVVQLTPSVELDEALLGKKRISNKGKSHNKFLVFGIVQRKGHKCILYVVPTNSRQELMPLIQKHIKPGCYVYTDGLVTYENLDELGYKHHTVLHNVELVTAEGVHTNTIEGLWGLIRQRVSHMHGLASRDRYAAHLDEFSFCFNYSDGKGKGIWNALIETIGMYYKF